MYKSIAGLGVVIIPLVVYASIKIPSSFDRDKVFAGLEYNMLQTSFRGLKSQLQVGLQPDGELRWKGVFVGQTRFGCSNQGGEANLKIDAKSHSDLVIQALKAIEENQKDGVASSGPNTRPDKTAPTLNVEYDNNYYFSGLVKSDSQAETKKFIQEANAYGMSIFSNKKAQVSALSLSVKRDFKSRTFEAELKNSGNKKIKVMLPKHAGEHFVLRMGEGGMIALDYAKAPRDYKQMLNPGQSLRVKLSIPKEVAPASGLLIYDNTPPIEGDYEPDQKSNSIAVSLCPILPNGTRADLK